MAWLLANYKATTLFSLKVSNATSSAAKSLICPTPYSIKMALLDAAIRTWGLDEGKRLFLYLRDMSISARLPPHAVVSNCFIKVLDPRRGEGKKDQGKDTEKIGDAEDGVGESDRDMEALGPLKSNITFREYVYFDGSLELALGVEPPDEWLTHCLLNINSLGKRGCFFQLQDIPARVEMLPTGYLELTRQLQAGDSFLMNGLTQVMDDMAGTAEFDNVNTFSSAKGAREKRVIVLPYRMRTSSKGFTLYERIER